MQWDWILGMILIAALGGYVVISLLLLKFPTLIHEKKRAKFKAVHISHRGGAGENLENTIAAFEHARDVGTDMLEIDCHLTKDGQVVVSHDNNLHRSTGQEGWITETLHKDMPLLRENLRADFHWTHETVGGEDRSIPLLREVFEKFKGMPINIDIKINNDELIEKVSKLITEFNREELTVWGNRSHHVVNKCYSQNQNIPILFSLRKTMVVLALFYTGLLPFIPLRESFYEVLMPSVLLKKGKFPTQFGWKTRLILRIFDFLLMNRILINHLKARGIQVYLWVLNEEDEWDRAFEYGAIGVMTDFPSKLASYLDKHPH